MFGAYLQKLVLVVLASFVFTNSLFAESELFGQYIGTLRHDKLKKEQLAKLDFIFAQDPQGGPPKISAVLTLHFGDFNTGEYVSYHFTNVRHNIPKGLLFFSDIEVPLSLTAARVDGKTLSASVRTKWTQGDVGQLILKRQDSVTPTLPLIQSLSGEHIGQCDGIKTKLQLLSYRSNKSINNSGNPFYAYEIRGQFLDRTMYQDGTYANMSLIWAGSYNFFLDELTLSTRKGKITCHTTSQGIECGKCSFAWPDVGVGGFNTNFKPRTSPAAFPFSTNGNPVVFKPGNYKGYVHHETLDIFQEARIQLTSFPTTSQGTRLEPKGQLFFGSEHDREMIPLQFEEQSYPNPIGPGRAIVLTNSKSDTDSTVWLAPAEEGVLRGVWYSHIFGRVGTVELRRDGMPPINLSEGAKVMGKLSGQYRSALRDLDISVREENTPLNTANPFAPNIFEGSFWIRPNVTYPIRILGGSYNYFTGRVALEQEPFGDSGPPKPASLWVGTRFPNGEFSFSRAQGNPFTRDSFEPEIFKPLEENSRRR